MVNLWNFALNFQSSAVLVMNLDSTNIVKYPENSQDTYTSSTEMARSALGTAYSKRWQFFKQHWYSQELSPAGPCWTLALLGSTSLLKYPCTGSSIHRAAPGADTAFHLFHQRMEQAWNISWIMYLSWMSHIVLWNCADGCQIPSLEKREILHCFASWRVKQNITRVAGKPGVL